MIVKQETHVETPCYFFTCKIMYDEFNRLDQNFSRFEFLLLRKLFGCIAGGRFVLEFLESKT